MKKVICHKILNLSVSDFILDTNIIPRMDPSKNFFAQPCDTQSFLKPDIYKKLSALGTLFALVFEMRPKADKGNIHIDLDHKTEDTFWPSLNIIISGQGLMRWFNPIRPGQLAQHKTGVKYRYWTKPHYGDIIDEWNTGKIALVRTDIPHQAFNFDDENRCVVSIRWDTKMSWEETTQWFDEEWSNIK